jgi:dTDP-4-amino-4,6-dideoxygalactose transaminase
MGRDGEGGRIPFNRAAVTGGELELISDALASGQISGDGRFSRRCEQLLGEILGARGRVLLTPSGTQALELSAMLIGVGPGDEVIGPSFTFPSSLGAFALRGASPRFADIRPDTLNIDERRIEQLIGPRTRAIVCTHYAGVGCEMDEMLELGARYGIPIVEDAAHGLFGSYRDRALGTMGRFGILSFHETKNVTSGGEGGALILGDAADVERAEMIREKGTDRVAFFRGEVDAYTWREIGSNYLLSEPQAAYLLAQLQARDRIQDARRRSWTGYLDGLRDWADRSGVMLPAEPADRRHPWHLFHLLLPEQWQRDALLRHLDERGVHAVFHYQPLHLSPVGLRLAPETGSLPVTEDVAGRLLRLPLHFGLGDDEREAVIEAVRGFEP